MPAPNTSYKGNPKLKKLNQKIEWTPELMQEFARCKLNPIYFASTYVKLIHVDHGLINMTPYPYQSEIIRSFAYNRYTVVATARQAGKTSAMVAAILHYALFNPAKTIGILANRATTARQILTRVQLAYENLPKWLQQGVATFNKGSMVLENKSEILADATNSDSIRGWSLSVLFIDEAAFVQNWDDFFTSVYPTITSGKTTKVVLVSTPKGLNHFYRIWTDANRPKPDWNGYHPIRVSWEDVPGRDQEWADQQMKIMTKERFNQEMCIKFLGSTKTLIDANKLEAMVWRVPVRETGTFRIYEESVKGKNYVITADVSHGKGLDYSAFNILDVSSIPYKQVASFRDNNVDPVEYAEILHRTAKLYQNAHLLIELNDIGTQVIHILRAEFEYENLISTGNKGRLGKSAFFGWSKQAEYGIRTTKSSKAVGCAMLKELIERDQLIINDSYTIEELSTFSKIDRIRGTTFEAEEGKTDDIVMSLVLFGWLTDQEFFKELTDTDIRSEIRQQNEDRMQENMLVMGWKDDGSLDADYDQSHLEFINSFHRDSADPRQQDQEYLTELRDFIRSR